MNERESCLGLAPHAGNLWALILGSGPIVDACLAVTDPEAKAEQQKWQEPVENWILHQSE